jgi:preprotein translocase subunit SecF
MVDFLRFRLGYALFSGALLLMFLGTYIYKVQTRGEGFIYSVDFTGGTEVRLSFSTPVSGHQVVTVLEANGFSGVETRDFSSTECLVRVKTFVDDAKGVAERIRALLQEKLPGTTVTIRGVDSVSAGVGASLKKESTKAVIVALLFIMFFIWWRFWSFSFAVGALVSLFHDAFVILGFFMIFDYEINLQVIGAILMVLGYSINDTIVIFSRIRDNIVKLRGKSIEDVVNISTNETLRRTLLTSFATSLVVVSLIIFGGDVLRTMSLALFVGIVFGTYSSICIANPVMLLLYKENK